MNMDMTWKEALVSTLCCGLIGWCAVVALTKELAL